MLAHNYKWSKHQILNEVYPEEVELYLVRIRERKKEEVVSKIDDLLLQMTITTAPHMKGGGQRLSSISRELQMQRRRLVGDGKGKGGIAANDRIQQFFEAQIAALEKEAPDQDDNGEATSVPNRGDEHSLSPRDSGYEESG